MTAPVLDASAVPAWCFADEASAAGWQMLERVRAEGARVPGIWSLEIANILVKAERRARIDARGIAEFLGLVDELAIAADADTHARATGAILALARAENLSAYDAAYLELALREGRELATRDRGLAAAGRRAGATVLAI